MISNKKVFRSPIKRSQSGATLIVVLVILVAMTFLGLGGMSDSNLQLAMVRNSQLQTGVYTAALTEINAQLDAINTNNESDVDNIILNLVQTTVEADGSRENSFDSDNDLATDLFIDDILGTDANSYTTSLTIAEPNANSFLPVSGMSLSPDSTVKWLVMEFTSDATITNSGSRSIQTQGFKYLSAN